MTSVETIEVGNPIRARDHVLLPIERTSMIHDSDAQRCWCHGSKQLIGLVVQTAFGTEVFEMETGPMTISELKKILPELEARLKRHASSHSADDASEGACFFIMPERFGDVT